jgi:hypothetical protein
LDVWNQLLSLLRLAFFQALRYQMLNSLERWIFRSFGEIDFRCHEKLLTKNDLFLVRQFKDCLVCVLVEMRIFITAFQQMTMLMLYLPHDFHSSPFIHFGCQLVLVDEVVSVHAFLLKRVFVKLSSDCLTANVGPDRSFVVDETFNHWNNVGKLCANIDNQATFEGEKVSRENCRFVHEEAIKFVGFVEKLNKLLPVLFATERRLDIKERVF